MILRPDASSIPFEAEDIQTRIIRACIAAGETESWIAGDLSLSVEFALLSSKKRVIRSAELDNMIVRVLEDSGYPHVAESFRKSCVSDHVSTEIEITEKNIVKAISSNFYVPPASMDAIAFKVAQALEKIGFSSCSPRLMLELARQFRDTEKTPVFELRAETHPLKNGDQIALVSGEELTELCSPEVRKLIGEGIFTLHEIRRLFSVLRIDFSWKAVCDYRQFPKPVTELALSMSTGNLVSTIDEICRLADSLCYARDVNVKPPIPLYLNFTDAIDFAVEYMECPRENAENCISSLLTAFSAQLVRKPFKLAVH